MGLVTNEHTHYRGWGSVLTVDRLRLPDYFLPGDGQEFTGGYPRTLRLYVVPARKESSVGTQISWDKSYLYEVLIHWVSVNRSVSYFLNQSLHTSVDGRWDP